jgi:hypothetical protein
VNPAFDTQYQCLATSHWVHHKVAFIIQSVAAFVAEPEFVLVVFVILVLLLLLLLLLRRCQ